MDNFYFILGKWTFIGGGGALVMYFLVRLEKYLSDNKKFKKIDKLQERFEKKDTTLNINDLDTLDNLYQWFIKRNFDSKLVREKYLDKLEKYEKWLEDERSLKWAKATYHFCSGYIINRDGHKVRAMCRVHKETNIKSSLKILTDSGYWVSDESLNVNDMVIQRYDLTFPENL